MKKTRKKKPPEICECGHPQKEHSRNGFGECLIFVEPIKNQWEYGDNYESPNCSCKEYVLDILGYGIEELGKKMREG